MIKTGLSLIAALLLSAGIAAAQERPLPESNSQPAPEASPEPGQAPQPRPQRVRTDRQPDASGPARRPAGPVTDELGHVLVPGAAETPPASPGTDDEPGPDPEMGGRA
ncbi:hypothetical protein [uncultured Maricaulis sp.]|uniref:hypothetical protein n=1 Tax=uncultured Maricaulis sp. TaxID=174710 RepID=UPI0030DAC33B